MGAIGRKYLLTSASSSDFYNRPEDLKSKMTRMIYPYTIGAKLAQFPYKFHFEKHRLIRCIVFAMPLNLYIFYKIQKLACSPANVKRHELAKEKEAKERAKLAAHAGF